MTVLPVCVLYSRDAAFVRRVTSFLATLATVKLAEKATRVESLVQQFHPTLLILDLRSENWPALLGRITKGFPETLIVAFGVARSDPALAAESIGVYAVEDPGVDDRRLQSLVSHALGHLAIQQENRALRKEQAKTLRERFPAASDAPPPPFPPVLPFSRGLRNFDNVDAMLESVVEGVASCARVSRVGVFALSRDTGAYRFRTGLRCVEGTRELKAPPDDPLVQWMQANAHLISRLTLEHTDDPSEYALIKQALDSLGAEAIIPLHGQDQLIGWLFVGHRVTGIPFSPADLENLMLLGEQASAALEKALLYEEIAVQKTLAETVLRSIPVGIAAAGADGVVRWFNEAAETILHRPAADVVGQPIQKLTSRLAGQLAQCLEIGSTAEPIQWKDPETRREIFVLTRRLMSGGQCMGALAIIRDVTQENLLRERQSEVERATFWTELAAAMSHEIRNPLVAISTFAQLLPERYADTDFRTEFSKLVGREVERLNEIITQINTFANPRALEFRALNLGAVLKMAVRRAKEDLPESPVEIELSGEDVLPRVQGDQEALVDCFARLIVNALEAVEDSANPSIHVTAVASGNRRGKPDRCLIHVQDNGKGIKAEVRDKVFSPFSTTKARGIGLGLPIARRTVTDHNGTVDIRTGSTGTTVTISLPAIEVAQEVAHETPAGRG